MASTSDTSPHSQRPKAASRLIHSVKRTLSGSPSMPSSRKRYPSPSSKSGMHSTVAESGSSPQHQQHQFREPDPLSSRPTIEQIAMGLHVSRTPHLRPHAPYTLSQLSASGQFPHHTGHRPTPIALPPPPARSSMKKTGAGLGITETLTSSSSSPAVSPPPFSSVSSGSTTTITSVTPSGGSGQPRAFSALKFRMPRFLQNNSRSSSAPSSMSSTTDDSPRSSASEYPPSRKKAVRFTTGPGTESVSVTADRAAGDGES